MRVDAPLGRANRLVDLGVIVTVSAVFLLLASHQLTLPGLYYDEALDAWPALRVLQERPQEFSRDASVSVFGRELPIMVMEYVGPINLYLSLAAFRVFGVSVEAVRIIPIVTAIAAIVFLYELSRLLFSRWAAAGAVLLLAVSPSYIFWSRQGFHVTSVMSAFLYGGLLAFVLWWRRRNAAWFVVGCFAFGMGITAKFLFLWVILAAPLAALLAGLSVLGGRRLIAELRERIGWRTLLAGAGAFLAGASPLLLYNLMTAGTIDVLTRNAVTTEQGVNNLDVATNLLARLRDLRAILDGAGQFWFLGGVFSDEAMPWAAGGGLLLAGALVVSVARAWRWPVLFLAFFAGAYLLQSAFTVSGLGATHLYMLIGIPQLMIAAALWLLGSSLAGRNRRTVAPEAPARGRSPASAVLSLIAGVAIIGTLAATELRSVANYHRVLGTTGGYLNHSDMVYELSTWMEDQQFFDSVAMDWGIARNVEIASQGRIAPEEIFIASRQVRPEFYTMLEQAMQNPNNVWLFHVGDAVNFPRQEEAERFMAERGRRFRQIDTLAQRDGKIILRVMELE